MQAILAGYILWLLVCAAAVWRGGALRVVGLAMLVAIVDTPLLRDRRSPLGMQTGILAVDIALMIVFVGVHLEARHRWSLFAAAFQVLETLTHIARLIDGRIHARSYEISLLIWSLANLAAVAAGVIAPAFRPRTRLGARPDGPG